MFLYKVNKNDTFEDGIPQIWSICVIYLRIAFPTNEKELSEKRADCREI